MPDKNKLTITRMFHAPRESVFTAWTSPEILKRWWGPHGFTTPVFKAELREGGRILSCMRSPDGKDYWSTGEYRQILRPERLLMTDSFADEKGSVVPALHYGMSAEFPLEMLIEVRFEDRGEQTRMTLEHLGMPASEHGMCAQGWNESFEKLDKLLESITAEQSKIA